MKDMLCALLLVNHESSELLIQYFNIEARHSTYSLATKTGHEGRAAVELSILPDATEVEIRNALSITVDVQSNVSVVLVEYPKLLYAGFANVLHCLQNMTDFDYAFGEYISPRHDAFENDERVLQVRPPSYARLPGFSFDLSPLTGKADSRVSIDDLVGDNLQHAFQQLEENTTFDHSQAIALLTSLNRELSFTQGPPGCGKTYVGIALTRVLASRPTGQRNQFWWSAAPTMLWTAFCLVFVKQKLIS